MIQFENVSKAYGTDRAVVSDLNLEIKDGEFFVFIGPSGSGKTTTLKMINRLIPLTTGYIKINNTPISDYKLNELRWNIGYVLQQIALFPHMTVAENIIVVPEMKKWSKTAMKDRVTELLESVGMDPSVYRNRMPGELSGGEQQRVGIARALAADPDIILMDEPFSALDPISRSNLQKDVMKMKQSLKKTIVFVTHDIREALALGDRICILNEGKVAQIGTPEEIVKHPADDFVRDFLHSGYTDVNKIRKVQLLLDKGHWTENTDEKQAGEAVSVTDSITSLIVVLAENSEAAVKGADGQLLGKITQQHLLAYLATATATGGEQE